MTQPDSVEPKNWVQIRVQPPQKWIRFGYTNSMMFHNFRDKNHSAGISVGGATTLLLSVSSLYSSSLRCKMLLIIPGLFAERGRSIVLWTFSSGLLIDGPIRSIYVNLQRLYDTIICMYQVTLKESCQSKVINRKVISNVSKKVLNMIFQISFHGQFISVSRHCK